MPHSSDQFKGIFICYRRDDSSGHAGRLYDRLTAHFGDEQIFMDIDYIEPGEDFVQVIEDAVGSCEILLPVIGRRWLLSADGASRRLDNPLDFVRLEIAAALRRNIRVIPVLVQGANMPGPLDLPDELLPLSRRQALDLSDQRWRHDITRLIEIIERIFSRLRDAQSRETHVEKNGQRKSAEAQAPEAETDAALRAGVPPGQPIQVPVSLRDVEETATPPSKDESISKIMFLINAQAQRLATVISAVPRNLAVVVRQVSKQKRA